MREVDIGGQTWSLEENDDDEEEEKTKQISCPSVLCRSLYALVAFGSFKLFLSGSPPMMGNRTKSRAVAEAFLLAWLVFSLPVPDCFGFCSENWENGSPCGLPLRFPLRFARNCDTFSSRIPKVGLLRFFFHCSPKCSRPHEFVRTNREPLPQRRWVSCLLCT